MNTALISPVLDTVYAAPFKAAQPAVSIQKYKRAADYKKAAASGAAIASIVLAGIVLAGRGVRTGAAAKSAAEPFNKAIAGAETLKKAIAVKKMAVI